MDDGTGMIVVQDFTDDYGSFEPALELHTYAYVVGRVMISEKEISAFCVRPILDFNQIPFHLMLALYVHLHLVHGLPHGSVYASVEHLYKPSTAPAPSPIPSDSSDRVCETILTFLRRGNTHTGTHHRTILAEMSGQFAVDEIDRGIERLKQRCDIYMGDADCWIPIS
jgi:hypothetical protein